MNQDSTFKTVGKSVLTLLLISALLMLHKMGSSTTAAAQSAAGGTLDKSVGYYIYQPLTENNAEIISNTYPTRTPIASFTPTAIVTQTPTPLPTNTPTPGPTVCGPGDVPYAVFHNSNYDRTYFDGSIISGSEWRTLDDVRARGQHVIGAAAISDPCYYMPTGPDNFNVDQLVNDILARHDDILNYASDGTLMGIMELNEPQDPNCEEEGGQADWKVPQWALYQVASRFWQAFPELTPGDFYFGFGTPPTYTEEGGGSPDINLAFIQYAGKPGETVESWAAPQQASAARQGQQLIYSANLYFLGVDGAVAANIWECQQSDALMVSVWNDTFVQDSDGSTYAAAKAVCDANAP